MKTWRLPRLSRGGMIIRNLAVTAFALVFLWGLLDFPILPPYLSYRRAERAGWVGPSNYQGALELERETWAVGTTEDWVLFHMGDWPTFEYWPKAGAGATLCPVPLWTLDSGERYIVAVDLPEGTTWTELEATISCWALPEEYGRVSAAGLESDTWTKRVETPEYWTKTYGIAGDIQKEGAAFYPLFSEDTEPNSLELWNIERACDWTTYQTEQKYRYVNCEMEAVFYDQNRSELGRARLTTPDE